MDLTTFGTAARRWWYVILGCAVVAAILALAVSQILPREYSAESRVLVGNLTDTSTDKLTAYQQLAQTYSELVTTTPSVARIAAAAGVTNTPDLASQIDAHAPIGGTIIAVSAVAPTAEEATRLADAAAAEIVRLAEGGTQPSLATVVQPATLPLNPSSPRTLVNVIVATFIGLAIGLLGVFLLAVREQRQAGRSEHDRVVTLLEERFGRRAG